MYLQLAGPQPTDTAENPLAPGAPNYKYDAVYLGASADIALPDALYAPSVAGYADALKKLSSLYDKYAKGKKRPSEVVKGKKGMGVIDPVTLKLIMTAVGQGLQALAVVARGAQATAANNRITEMYNGNMFNVQNLNRLTGRQIADQIEQIDSAISATPKLQFGRQMALARFRLVYQQRFDEIGGGVGLPSWALYAALGLGALLILRRK